MHIIENIDPDKLSLICCEDTIIISTIEKKLIIEEDILGNILIKNPELINLSDEKKIEGLFIKKRMFLPLKMYIPKGISFSIEKPRKSNHIHSLYYNYVDYNNDDINIFIEQLSVEIYFDYMTTITNHVIPVGDTLFELRFTNHNTKKILIYDKDTYMDFSNMLC